MHSLQKQFHDFVSNEDLLTKGDQVLVAVSGGLDSTVLVDLLSKTKFSFAVAHCNFGLRNDESDGDEDFVKKCAEKYGVTFHTKRFELGSGSIQLNARNARYEWFEELCKSHGYQKIATAHHLNDSLETSLINLTRGTGPKGIQGIKSKTGSTIRPLLFASKEELKNYAQEIGLDWREDSSNSRADYDRNAIRLEVIPKLEEMNPSLISTFSHTSERFSMAAQLVTDEAKAIKKDNFTLEGKRIEFNTRWILKKSHLLILSEILSEYGFNYSTSKEIYFALDKPGKIFLSADWELSVDRGSVFFLPILNSPNMNSILGGYGDFEFESGTLSIHPVDKAEVDFRNPETIIYVDEDQIEFPLQLRSWRQGDKFYPLGMKGSKKISDFLIDNKVPVAEKRDALVLISNTEIVWLVGYQISDRVKIEERTQRVVKVELRLS